MEDGQETMQGEVKKLQEVPRPGEHCGKPMARHVVGQQAKTARYAYICARCGHQEDGGLVDPPAVSA